MQVNVAPDGLCELFAGPEMMALQDILDLPFEAFEHAVRLRSHRRRVTVLDAEICAELIELVLPRRIPPVRAGKAVGEGASIVGQNPCDLHWLDGACPRIPDWELQYSQEQGIPHAQTAPPLLYRRV